jgi:hypothetical protein
MDNKDPWVSYDKVSTSSDAFAYVQEIGNDLSDSLEHLNQGSPVRAKGLPTEKYTAGNTNDVMEGVHEESFLTQTPSKISRRYSPMTKSEYSGYRPPDPVFLSYNNSQTTNTFLPESLAKHKTIEDIDKVEVNNKFVVNKLNSTVREAAIAPEALELINILNPVEAREIQNNTVTQEVKAEKYTSSITPIEVKRLETKTNSIVQNSATIVIGKPKTLSTYNQVNNNSQISNESTNISKNEVTEIEASGPTFTNNVNQTTNQSPVNSTNIEIKKASVTPKISQYTNTIDFNSFVSSSFTEIVDQKTEQKLLSRNNINVKKLVTDINLFLEQNKKEFRNNLSSSVNQFFSTYSEDNISNLQSSILNVIDSSDNIESLDVSVSKVINEYFLKNQNEFNQDLVTSFINNFNSNLQTQLINLQQNSSTQLSTVENINSVISNIKNIYESNQAEIEKIISEVNNDNVLNKVVELANTYQNYKTLSTSSINTLANQINQINISEIKETFNKQISDMNVRNETSLSTFKQELYGFMYSYLSSSVEQETFNTLLSLVTTSNNVDQINSIINEFVSYNRTESNSQVIDSLQYFSNDKYSNIVSSNMVEIVENNILNSLSKIIQNYSNQDVVKNSLVKQIKNELAQTLNTDINNTVNNFAFSELKTSIENVYKSQDINEFKSEFENVLNKSENSSNTQLISYLNGLLENNISQYTSKSVNVLNDTRYANSVKKLVNENLHNVVSNIVHNLSEVNTYSDNKNISTLINNIKIINDKLLINNAESRLQNFNLIQTSIENFLNNTETNFATSLSNVKTNQNSYSNEIVENLSTFDLLSSYSNTEDLTEVKNLINNLNSQSFNEESNKFVQDAKLYTDLINMKSQITSELNNFVSTTFETILQVNQSSSLVSSQQIINLIEDTVSSFNNSSISSKAISYIQNTFQDAKKPELYNNTFQLITSTNVLEEQVKNYLLQNNSVLADYSLQQILSTINQPVYSDYVTFQDIKEIVNTTTSKSSFGILSEIKQYINQVNSQENAQFISNLKTYLAENQSDLNYVNNNNFSEELKTFISEQNSYSPETFNQIINSVSNKFENKSAIILNQLMNENVEKINQVVETLYSSTLNNESKENILNTLSTFINNSADLLDVDNNFLTEQTNSFKLENNDFIQNLNNILSSNNNIISEDIKNDFKKQIFNDLSTQVLAVLNKNEINSQQINNIIQSSSSVETKTNDIKSYLTNLENVYQDSVFASEIKYAQSFLKNEITKIDVLNNPYNLSTVNLDTVIENTIKNNIQYLKISKSFVESINDFRTQISDVNSVEEVKNYSSNQKNILLNDVKKIVNDFISTVKPEYLTLENLNTINSATSVEQISNTLSENKNGFSFSENNSISNILNQSLLYSEIIESVTENILSDNNFSKNILMQKFDNVFYESVQKQINNVNGSLIKNIISNVQQLNISESTSNQDIKNVIATSISNTLSKQEVYINEVLNSFNIDNINEHISTYNQEIIKSINSAVQNYDVSKLLTNTISENISLNQNIVNNDVIENFRNVLEGTNVNIENSEEMIKNFLSNQTFEQQIKKSLNINTIRKLFNQSIVSELGKNSSTVREILEEKSTNNQLNLISQFLNKTYHLNNETKNSINNEIKNEIEKIENITLNFENQNYYQRSSIQVYDEVTNKFETSLPDGFDKVNLNESTNTLETNTTNNNFKNITVVKQIDENEDVNISNFRIEKVWNKFVQDEVTKIVEEVNNQTQSTIQENIYNQQNTTVNQSSRTENFNKSEINYNSENVNNTENLSVYNTFNTQQPGFNTSTKETEERVDYREITELVFTRIEEKLKTFSVTEEDIIILRHKILSEVTEIYEKKSRVDIQKSEEKMKKEMQDLFIKFLNS